MVLEPFTAKQFPMSVRKYKTIGQIRKKIKFAAIQLIMIVEQFN